MRSRVALALLTATLTGCRIGTGAHNFRPATEPAGITVELRATQGSKLVGELLEVRDAALLVLADGAVRLAPYATIEAARFRQRSQLNFGSGATPTRPHRDAMRLVARFPAGLTPELLERLLQIHGQTAPTAFP